MPYESVADGHELLAIRNKGHPELRSRCVSAVFRQFGFDKARINMLRGGFVENSDYIKFHVEQYLCG
jgi:hypothetical protein